MMILLISNENSDPWDSHSKQEEEVDMESDGDGSLPFSRPASQLSHHIEELILN